MTYEKPIGSLRYRVTVQHLQEQVDDIGNVKDHWISVRSVWISLQPTHNYRSLKNKTVTQFITEPHYQMMARFAIFYKDIQGNLHNIWHKPFRLLYKNFYLKPLVYPAIDSSKYWISAVVEKRS